MLLSIAYILLAGVIFGWVAKYFKLPPLIGMLIAGIVIGELDILSPKLVAISPELRQLALVIILLRAGLALKIKEIKKVGRSAILMSFVPALCEIACVVIIAPLIFDVTTMEAALIGSVLAAVSPAVIVPAMLNLMNREKGTKKGIPQMIMAAGSLDDIFVVVLFAAFLTLDPQNISSLDSYINIPISLVTGMLMGVSCGYILNKIFKIIRIRSVIKLVLVLSISILFLSVEEALKDIVAISGLLAVMSMGVTLLSLSEHSAKELSSQLSRVWVLAEIVLFVLVGSVVDINFALGAGISVIGLIIFALMFRVTGAYLSLLKTNLTPKERLFCMIAFTPKATVQAAIGAVPLSIGLACGDLVLTVAVVAILITAPLGAIAINKFSKWL